MNPLPAAIAQQRESVLNPVERISEMLFGLFMALTFTGAMSAATSGRDEVRTMFIAALGCNLAWGLVDAIMYLVRTATDRGRSLAFLHAVRASDTKTGGSLVMRRLAERFVLRQGGDLLTPAETEAIHARVVAMPVMSRRATLERRDFLAAAAIFVIVVAATFPVVLPFALVGDVDLAKNISRAVALAMLFCGGYALGRYAGYGELKAGFTMAGLGTTLVIAIKALGG